MLAAIAEAVKRRQAGEDPYGDPSLRAILPPQEFPQPNIVPPKPDPERAANQAIDAAVAGQGRAPAVQGMIEARKGNKINPETGMPFYNNPEQPQEDPQEAMKREFRMKYLQEMSAKGRR